jgi:uncharacterized cupredoxin-like copper-binding protein
VTDEPKTKPADTRRLPVPRKLLVALVVIALPFAAAACGDDDETTAAPASGDAAATEAEAPTTDSGGGGETVAISETEYKIDPADPTVKAGSVTFDVTNDGATAHDLEIEGDGVEEVTDTIEPGASDQLTVDLEPGTYEMYCTIGGHADLGMEGQVTVQ